MRSVYLVCEGHADGLDVRVLDVVVAQKLDVPVMVVPGLAEAYSPGLFVPDDFAALAQRLRDLAG